MERPLMHPFPPKEWKTIPASLALNPEPRDTRSRAMHPNGILSNISAHVQSLRPLRNEIIQSNSNGGVFSALCFFRWKSKDQFEEILQERVLPTLHHPPYTLRHVDCGGFLANRR